MTADTIRDRSIQRLDNNSIYYRDSEVLAAINEGQRIFVLLTLCLQKTASLALSGGTIFYSMLSQSGFEDWLVPLNIRVQGGAKVLPARLQELDARNPSWQAATGDPERYAHLGFDFLSLDPHPSGSGTTLDITYAHGPAVITTFSGTPEIEEEDHPALIDWCRFRLRAKEGGQEFQKGIPLLDRFLDVVAKRARAVRERNLESRYDNVPPEELDRFDRSRLLTLANQTISRPFLQRSA